jgi:branched-subunit amino acid aminotransferase/4-amino-4-deoxychorismate lyase
MQALYESMIGTRDGVRLLDRHLRRLADAGVPGPVVEAVIERIANVCLALDQPAKLRVTVRRDGVTAEVLVAKARRPLRLKTVPGYDPSDAERAQKRLHRAWIEPARSAAVAAGADEALVVSEDGRVGETTTSNVFLRDADGRLLTPAEDGITPGVVRSWVLEQRRVEVRAVTDTDLRRARSAFLTTAGRGIVPVTAIDDRVLEDDPEVDALHHAWLALPLSLPVGSGSSARPIGTAS